MNRLLALSVLACSVLTGCGSSGGSSPASVKKYTFEFVKLDEGEVSTCTIFDGLEQNIDTKYVAYKTGPQNIDIHDENGIYSKSLTNKNGVITFSENDVPDGGYVSVIEYVPGSKNYQVLSIQKALLGDYLIRLNTGSGSDCYTTNKGISKKSGTASITDEGLASNYFQYITTQETTSLLVGTRNYKTSAYTDEKVLAKGYNGDGNDLIAYGFSTLNGTATELSEVPDSLDWYTDFDLNGLESLAVSLKKGNYTYAWFDAEFDPTLDTRKSFPFSYDESEWLYTATGSINDWKFHHNARFTDTLDVSLMANMDDSGNPEISYNGTSYIFDAPGISSSNDLIQRSYYYTETTGPNAALTHIIYSVPSSDGKVIIPDLKLDSPLSPEDFSDIAVSIVATESMDEDFVESFMRRFQPVDPNSGSFSSNEDSISLLLSPADQLKQRQNTEMNDYTLVER